MFYGSVSSWNLRDTHMVRTLSALADHLTRPRHRAGRAGRGQRRPEAERLSHYFFSELPSQFDAIMHIDETRAVQPLETHKLWRSGETPETYPTAL